MSDSMLRIQVRVAAREAAKQLQGIATAVRAINSSSSGVGGGGAQGAVSGLATASRVTAGEIRKIERALTEVKGTGSFTQVGKDAAKFNAGLRAINRNMKELSGIKRPPWASEMGAATSKWSPAIAAQQQAKAAKAAQVQIAGAARQTAAIERQEAARTKAFMSQVWKQQVREARAAAAAERGEAAKTRTFMNQVWNQQVREAHAAKRAEAQAARVTAAEQRQIQRQTTAILNAEWNRQQAEYKATQRAEVQATRAAQAEIVQLKKSASRQRAAADAAESKLRSAVAAGTGQHDPFVGRLAALDMAVNGVVNRTRQGMIQMGKNMQWVGRQINFNFTLPLLAATGMMMKWELANQSAFTRLKKVYGDTGTDYTEELDKVGQALRMLSDFYGVNQAEVIELGAQWAAAGLEAGDLAQAVQNSLILDSIGDYQTLSDTFDDLITVQTAFHLSASETKDALAILNTTENMTAATMQDLVTGITKVGGAADLAGVDIQHLAAMMAVLVPATGSAATAGTALQTIFSRLMQPTADMVEVLKLMGIEWTDQSFQMADGAGRLEILATAFGDLTRNQQAYVTSILASRRQYNKLAVLLTDMANAQGTYKTVLEATDNAKAADNVAELNDEVQKLLSSNPKRLEILKTMMQNMFADIIQPLIPAFLGFVGIVKNIVAAFASLPPGIQKGIFLVLGLAAAVGILAQMFGSFKLLFGQGISFVLGILRVFGIGTVAATSTSHIAMLEMTAASTAASAASAEASLAAALVASQGSTSAAVASSVASASAAAASASASATAAGAALAAEAGATGGMILIPLLIAAIVAAVVVLAVVFKEEIGGAIVAVWNWGQRTIGWVKSTFNSIVQTVAEFVATIIEGVLALPRTIKRAFVEVMLDLTAWGEAAWTFVKIVFERIGRYVIDTFMAFPRAVAAAFNAIIQIIAGSIKIIREWLSWLNPFARHSPSLVDNVKAGVAVIAKEYASLANVMSFLGKAADDLERFGEATGAAGAAARQSGRAEQRQKIVANSPNAGPATDALYGDLDVLYAELDKVSAAIIEQEKVVKPLRDAYEAADWAVKEFEASMEPLKVAVEALENQMEAAKDKIDDFADMPIIGMKAMSDAIWENEFAQKELRLEMLRLEDAGQGFDQIKDKLAALNGDIESTRATMSDLRQAGAGSDVLATYQEQLDALEAQKVGLEESGQQALDLQTQLEALQRAGEVLNLEQAIQFDPLIKQIDDLANATQEMSFDDIIAGITEQKQVLDDLTAAYEPQKAALDEQQLALDALILKRDILKAAYEIEDVKLQKLNDTYDKIEESIRGIESALEDAAKAFDTLNGSGGGAGGGGTPWDELTGEDFEQQLEDAGLSIDDFLAEMQKNMEDLDIFGPIKDAWHGFEDWLEGWAVPAINWLLSAWFTVKGWVAGAVTWGVNLILSVYHGIINGAVTVVNWFVNLPNSIITWVGNVVATLVSTGTDLLTGLWNGIVEGAVTVTEWFLNLGNSVISWIGSTVATLWTTGKDFLVGLLGGVGEGAVDVTTWFTELPGKVVTWIGDMARTLWQKGKDLIGGLMSGNAEKATEAATWFIGLPGQVLTWIGDTLYTLVGKGWDFITGLINGIVDKAKSLFKWFTDLPGKILGGIGDATTWLFDFGVDLIQGIIDGITSMAGSLWDAFSGIVDDITPWDGLVPFFAAGGIVNKATMAVIGEAGPEVVIPLTNAGRALALMQQTGLLQLAQAATGSSLPQGSGGAIGGSRTVHITMTGDLSFPNIQSGDDAERFISNLEMLAGV